MTIQIQLPSTSASEPKATTASSFATPAVAAEQALRQVVARVRTCKRVVVVSGAGVSTGAAIPDFRSASGLFNEKTKGGHSVKDLFHVRCLGHLTLLAKHHELITSLSTLSTVAPPTPFHSYLSTLDGEDRLLRCYTQNIDNLESKAGLQVSIPSVSKRKSPSKKGKEKALLTPPDTPESGAEAAEPKVIPLHGLLSTLHCTLCRTTVPLSSQLPLPPTPIPCPTCEIESSIRSALSERSRKSGSLRASVVLYGEEHPEGEAIGKAVAKDLKSVDCLIVCGTSLSIPGVKRVVKEMSKATKARRGKGKKDGQDLKVIYVNEEPPSKASEWDGVFDAWVQGDVQQFVVDYLDNPEYTTVLPKSPKKQPTKAKSFSTTTAIPPKKTPTTPTKRKLPATILPPTPISLEKSFQSKSQSQSLQTPTKAHMYSAEAADVLPTPSATDNEGRSAKRAKVERERSASPSPTPRGVYELTPVLSHGGR